MTCGSIGLSPSATKQFLEIEPHDRIENDTQVRVLSQSECYQST